MKIHELFEAIGDTDVSGYRVPRAHREEVGCRECGKMEGSEPCGSYSIVADPLCQSCRNRFDYQWCNNCKLNHIQGMCPQLGALAGKVKGK